MCVRFAFFQGPSWSLYQGRALSDHPIRFAAAERSVNDIKTFVSLFTADGAILHVVSATEYPAACSFGVRTSVPVMPPCRSASAGATVAAQPKSGQSARNATVQETAALPR